MNTLALLNYLKTTDLPQAQLDELIFYIRSSINAALFANSDPTLFEFLVVVRYSGNPVVYKLLNKAIVVDFLDPSYAASRDLVCLSEWNINLALSIKFVSNDIWEVQEVDSTYLASSLFSLVVPSVVHYVGMTTTGDHPLMLTADEQLAMDEGYKSFQHYLDSTYYHMLSLAGENEKVGSPQYFIVGYA